MSWSKCLVPTFLILACAGCALAPGSPFANSASPWLLVDDFESGLDAWTHIDVDNNTDPFVPNPQVADLMREVRSSNQYLLTKPAPDGIVGNRKAIGFRPLPVAIGVGETYTIYTRINVEYFPNNQSFGLANIAADKIGQFNYNAFEPMIRVTDKYESDGHKNSGALQVLGGGQTRYSDIVNPTTGSPARPLSIDEWYEVWIVVNNGSLDAGGQRYDVYVRGGEFSEQQQVFERAVFRMRRVQPLAFFMTICNTGPADKPYGNGGVRYDDIFMAKGERLTSPLEG
ncbi:MAG: hypothetical protein AAFN07_15685 [Pseudomonadota bacterium]